ncbi:MAG: hypothetical protein A2008_05150, partial [Candidatus Wallbacteria bacterium GWC2_49_35]
MSEEFNEKDQALFDRLADFVIRRKMTAPAILFLESTKPLNFIGSQFLVVMGPLIKIFFNIAEYDRIVELMEKRENVE